MGLCFSVAAPDSPRQRQEGSVKDKQAPEEQAPGSQLEQRPSKQASEEPSQAAKFLDSFGINSTTTSENTGWTDNTRDGEASLTVPVLLPQPLSAIQERSASEKPVESSSAGGGSNGSAPSGPPQLSDQGQKAPVQQSPLGAKAASQWAKPVAVTDAESAGKAMPFLHLGADGASSSTTSPRGEQLPDSLPAPWGDRGQQRATGTPPGGPQQVRLASRGHDEMHAPQCTPPLPIGSTSWAPHVPGHSRTRLC